MKYKSNNELKSISREILLGKYGTAIGAFLFMRAVSWSLLNVSELVANPNGIIFLLITFIISLIEGILVLGEQRVYLKIAAGEGTGLIDMLGVFKTDADRAIISRLLFVIIVYVPILTAAYGLVQVKKGNATVAAVVLVLALIAIVIMIDMLLNYAFVNMIMIEDPSIKVIAAYRKSRMMMKGRKKALLGMVIGFIPIHIIGVLSIMVGEIFIHPYYKMSLTQFYCDMKDK